MCVCFPQKFPTCFSQQSPEKPRWRPRCATSSWKSSRRTIAWNRSASTSAAWRRHATMAPRGAPVKAMKRWGVHWEKQGTIWGFTGKSETCDGFSKLDDQLISWFLDGGTVCETMFRFRLPKLTQIMVTSCYFSSAVLKTEYRVLVFLLWSSGEKKPILHFLCSHPITFSFRKAQWLKLTKRRSLQENQHMGNWKYFRLLAADRCWHPVAYRWPL